MLCHSGKGCSELPETVHYFIGILNKAFIIQKSNIGIENPDVAQLYNNIALVFEKQGNYGKAIKLYNNSLAIQSRISGDECPEVALFYNNIARIHDMKGEQDKALIIYKKALVIQEKVLGIDHPDIAITYNNIAISYYTLDKYTEAKYYSYNAVNTMITCGLSQHPNAINFKKFYYTCCDSFQNSSPHES
jgi:tetratricopeptide (TPR) repeat protein